MYSTSLLLFLFAAAAGAHGLYSFQVKRYKVSITSPKGSTSVCTAAGAQLSGRESKRGYGQVVFLLFIL